MRKEKLTWIEDLFATSLVYKKSDIFLIIPEVFNLCYVSGK